MVEERTQGSETSQYLEEKKKMLRSNTIPQVAASEKGTAQTGVSLSVQSFVFILMTVRSVMHRGCKAVMSFYEKSDKVYV